MPKKGVVLSPEAAAKQSVAIKKWHKENTVVISLRATKEKAAAYKALAERRGMPMATLIKRLLDAELKKPCK